MGALIIIAVLVLVWAYKTGRPMKLVLTPEEAKAVRAKWWRTARFELKLWAVAFVLGYALAGNALASEHWRWYVYVFIVWGSLLIFSRLAIWATVVWLALYFAAATFAHYLLKYDMPSLAVLVPILSVTCAIIIRAVLLLGTRHGKLLVNPPPPAPPTSVPGDSLPKYDWDTDTWLYENGNRAPAYIRHKKYDENHSNRLWNRDPDELR